MAESATVIAALRYMDGVLIAADSQATDPAAEVKWPVTKLRRVGSVNLVIGFSGSMGSGERVAGALSAANLRPNQLRRRIGFQDLLDRIVRPEYASAAARANPPGSRIPIWGLAAVCVESVPAILEYELSGDSCWHEHFHAIGSGARTAYAIWRTLGGRELSKLSEGTAIDVLLRVIQTAIRVEPMGVGEPIHVWKVDCSQAVEISDDELNAHLQSVAEWEAREREHLFAADRGEA